VNYRLGLPLTGRRKHLLDILEIDLHTGMRRTELLSLHISQMNFIRDEILLTKTKSGKPRLVPMHPNIRPLLQRLCNEAGPNGYLFEASPSRPSKRRGHPHYERRASHIFLSTVRAVIHSARAQRKAAQARKTFRRSWAMRASTRRCGMSMRRIRASGERWMRQSERRNGKEVAEMWRK
jgi:integrase